MASVYLAARWILTWNEITIGLKRISVKAQCYDQMWIKMNKDFNLKCYQTGLGKFHWTVWKSDSIISGQLALVKKDLTPASKLGFITVS